MAQQMEEKKEESKNMDVGEFQAKCEVCELQFDASQLFYCKQSDCKNLQKLLCMECGNFLHRKKHAFKNIKSLEKVIFQPDQFKFQVNFLVWFYFKVSIIISL